MSNYKLTSDGIFLLWYSPRIQWFWQLMRIGVVHHNLNSRGGGERIAVNVIELLKEMGFEVNLITSQKPDFDALEKVYNRKIEVDRVHSLLPFALPAFGIYQRVLTVIPARRAKVDLIINTHGDVLPIYSKNYASITYCHFPSAALTLKEYSSKYQTSHFWRAYYEPYRIIIDRLMKNNHDRGILLTNSQFSRKAIQRLYPESNPIIVYPSVDTKSFRQVLKSQDRENKVLVVSRFTPEKKLENAIILAKMLKVRIVLIGSLIPYNKSYFNFLVQMTKDYGVNELVKFLPNSTFDTLLNEMRTSKVYLHTMVGEHFGISIVEAMAAGLIPIVPDYGGCTEFVPREYQYNDISKMADNIQYAFDLPYSERERVSDIAEQFSEQVFKSKMKEIIEKEIAEAPSIK